MLSNISSKPEGNNISDNFAQQTIIVDVRRLYHLC